jgi:hypothetical protein
MAEHTMPLEGTTQGASLKAQARTPGLVFFSFKGTENHLSLLKIYIYRDDASLAKVEISSRTCRDQFSIEHVETNLGA